MLLGIVNQFAPAEHRPVAVASKGSGARAYAKHDQEDAQDFLSHLLNNAHLVRTPLLLLLHPLVQVPVECCRELCHSFVPVAAAAAAIFE